MFEIVESQMIVPNLHQLTVRAPDVVQDVKSGQFVILRAEDEGERIPLSIADWDAKAGTVTVFFLNVGATTSKLAALRAGDSIPTVVGPLGVPTEIDNYGTVLCLGGCYGIGSIYPIARDLKKAGNRVITVIEARSSYLFYWEEKLKTVSDEMFFITRDGTRGYKGHVPRLQEIMQAVGGEIDRVIINGCTFLVKLGSEVTRPSGTKTIVSLAPIMIDGTGMCGVCRVTIGDSTRFACVHGPDFDGHQVNWEELLKRRKMYFNEEVVPLHTSRCEAHSAEISG
ncbi:MAG: sulfide/dihydroorotate dehydrogenase-like FAD/NAD-binding protein [Calditrichaeota bacterium]|nr:sulfide/dihydroorotate dehydrogenase-like FAD/NAD-binding protein [Calditrichota bacterium]